MEDIYNSVMRMYDADKQRNIQTEYMRSREVYTKIPRIKEIDDTLKQLSCSAARLAISGSKDAKQKAIDDYSRQTEDLLAEKKQLLLENGYPEDHLDPIYTCPACHDTGIDGINRCSCFHKRIIQINYSASGIEDLLKKENFDNFDPNVYSKESVAPNKPSPYENAITTVKSLKKSIEAFDEGKPINVIFSGQTGVGKTFLCNCTTKALLDKGATLYYTGAFRMFNILTDAHFNRNAEKCENDLILNCDVLVIDDLGAEIQSAVTNAYFLDIINHRIQNGCSTIISTNLGIKDIFEKYGERMGSRFVQHFELYNLYGTDIRIQRRLT